MLDRVRSVNGSRLAVVVKGYPRLSETFIAQEILALEQRGFAIEIWSLRRPTDGAVHMMHRAIAAKPYYLPEYLYQEPLRVLRGVASGLARAGIFRLLGRFMRDLLRDPTPNRLRRLGQAMVLARELSPAVGHIHVHYLHTPCSVARYAAMLSGRSFSVSAHAKDIWTTPDWEKREKLAEARFAVTCTAFGHAELARLTAPDRQDDIELVYHGLDLKRFPEPPENRPARDGSAVADPVQILSVGRAVAKKGYDDLLAALARLPRDLNWRFTHIGSGELIQRLKADAASRGLSDRIDWLGSRSQDGVIAALRNSDLFVLPCKEGDNGDRDGLPNVILEAATQALPVLSTRFAGVPEFIRDGREGMLVASGDVAALTAGITALSRDPALRARLGVAARKRLVDDFSFEAGITTIASRLAPCMAEAAVG